MTNNIGGTPSPSETLINTIHSAQAEPTAVPTVIVQTAEKIENIINEASNGTSFSETVSQTVSDAMNSTSAFFGSAQETVSRELSSIWTQATDLTTNVAKAVSEALSYKGLREAGEGAVAFVGHHANDAYNTIASNSVVDSIATGAKSGVEFIGTQLNNAAGLASDAASEGASIVRSNWLPTVVVVASSVAAYSSAKIAQRDYNLGKYKQAAAAACGTLVATLLAGSILYQTPVAVNTRNYFGV